jgi:hypothetical protein
MTVPGMPLTLELYDSIEQQLKAQRADFGMHTLSEYTFSNLYFFRQVHKYRYLPGAYPCIAGITYDGERHLLPLFDPSKVPTDELASLMRREQACLYPIPESVVTGLDPKHFCWIDFASDADYFYPAENFLAYRGTLLRKKRSLMRGLLASHCMKARPLCEATGADALGILAGWMHDKKMQTGGADEDACTEALRLHLHFGLDGLVYYADEEPVGFLIAQRLVPGVAAMRFVKGRDSHHGIYQYMFHHYCACRIEQVSWLNFEQDLGLPNFRQTKRSYQPSSMLRKFRVRLCG